jgi:hypothetical protein
MAKRKQFTFYWSFYDALADLPLEQAKEGLWIIVTYALTGQMPEVEMEPAVNVAFKLIKPVLDTARKKAEGVTRGNQQRGKKKDDSQITPRCVPDNAQEGEKEVEIEEEVEVEEEIEKELEKESFTHMGSVPLVCVRDEFDFFWNAYPLKLGKKQAWLFWKKYEPELDAVMTALAQWKRSKKWQTEEGRYIPRADKFLEEKYYEQPPKDAVPMGASGYLGKAEMEAIERLMNESV